MLFLLGVVGVYAAHIAAADIDNDGDMDIVSVLKDKITWHENLGEDCFTAHVIAKDRPDSESDMKIIDMNGDGKLDLLTRFGWYQNVIGRSGTNGFCGPFALDMDTDGSHVPLYGVGTLHPADVDLDGDIDIVASWSIPHSDSGSMSPNRRAAKDEVVWFENVDGVFSDKKVISKDPTGIYDSEAGDLDGDGLVDAISVEYNSAKLAWARNLGGGAWDTDMKIVMHGSYGPDTIGQGLSSAFVADLNGDGRLDIVWSAYGTPNRPEEFCGPLEPGSRCTELGWVENLGGGEFGPPQIITYKAKGINSVSAADVDADGDMDVLVTKTAGEMLAWFENTGKGTFLELKVISEDVRHSGWVVAADMDGDGDPDVLSLTESPDMSHMVEGENIVWFENLATAENPSPAVGFDQQHKLLTCGGEETVKEKLAEPTCPEPTEAPDEDLAMDAMADSLAAGRIAWVVPTVLWLTMS